MLACDKKDQSVSDNLPPLFEEPITVPVNTKEGYQLNPFYQDTVPVPIVLNSQGDPVKSGIAYEITGRVVSLEKTAYPKSVPAGKPVVIEAYSNIIPVSNNLKSIEVDEKQLRQFVPKKDAEDFVLLSSTGDTIPTGTPIPVIEKRIKCRFPPPVKAQPLYSRYDAIYNIHLLDTEQGLLFSDVSALLEDDWGGLWIGQEGGCVSRYDGYNLFHLAAVNGMPNSFFTSLLKDKKGNIWVGTLRGGIARYDGTFITIFTEKNGLSNNRINCIKEDKNGNIWIGTGGGVSCYKPPKGNQPGTITNYTIKEGLSGMVINAIMQDKNGVFWFGTGARGVSRHEFTNNGQPVRTTYFTQKDGLISDRINDIIEDKNGNIWFATEEGACRYDLSEYGLLKKFTHYTFIADSKLRVRKILEDRLGNIWFGTISSGAFKLIQKGNEGYKNEMLVHFTKEEGLTSNNISSIIEDRSGNIWLGTGGGGVCCIRKRSITHLNKKEGLTENIINSIYEDGNGDIWYGTRGDGLIMYRHAKEDQPGIYMHYTIDQGLHDNFIGRVRGDGKGNLWMGSRTSGLCLFDGKTFTTFTDKSGLPSNEVTTLLYDRNGNIWVGTFGNGICVLTPGNDGTTRKSVVYYTEKEGMLDDVIFTMYEDRQGNIWIASGKGISRFQLTSNDISGTITHFTEKEGLPVFIVNAFYEDQTGKMWMGCSGGLVCYEASKDTLPDTFTFHGIRARSKIRNNIRGIGQDRQGNIWYSSMDGLNLIINNEDSTRLNQRINFSKSDGLKGKSFINNSIFVDHRHQLWCGNSSGGVEVVDLNNFELLSTVPQPKLTGLGINENFFDFRNIPDSLGKGIEYDSVPAFENYPVGLNLSYRQNNLEFLFSAIDWTAPHKIRYTFRMEGLNDQWSKPSNETKAEFRSLPYGDYTFEVKAFGETQQWSQSYKYPFRIRPPWWFSWWAYLMYTMLGGTVIYSTYRYQLKRKLELAEKRQLVELDRVKNRMYSNITHEFRTPLTLIHGPVAQALSKKTVLEQKDIQSIYRQSERLQQLINQMLELQKLEAGMLKPNYAYGEIIETLRYLFGSFEIWAKDKNISMLFSSTLQEVYMDFDQEKLTQIISNLVSNAIRHTTRGGKVAMTINPSPSAEFLLINVADTGSGISEEDLPYIFERFYQSKRASTGGTGIGLALVKNLTELLGGKITVESKPDFGSTFKLSLPITKHSHKPTEPTPDADVNMQGMQEEEINFITPEHIVSGKPIILIVEDHPEILQYVASCLVNDFNTITAMDGNEGLRLAYERIPDLIISDVMMPGKDGFELTRILKTDILTSHIPIILLTGRGDHDALLSGIEHGSDAYLTKPFDPSELVLRVKKLLELRANLSQHYRKHATWEESETTVQVSAKENEFMKKLRTIVEEHINDAQFNMNMLSKHMAMSHPQLHRKITALTGESTGRFVRSVRLAKAMELLKNSDLTISEIAYETGFSEPGYFTKTFSKEYNMSPSDFRRSFTG